MDQSCMDVNPARGYLNRGKTFFPSPRSYVELVCCSIRA